MFLWIFEIIRELLGINSNDVPNVVVINTKIDLIPENNSKLTLMNQQLIEQYFGKFVYTDKENAEIVIDKDWINENIVVVKLPIIGNIRCHKKIQNTFISIWEEIEKSYSAFIDIQDTIRNGGCFVPRHMMWNNTKPLSHHSFGIAQDINPTTNAYGTKGTMNKGIIEISNKHLVIWGGIWKSPDAMHFECSEELAKIL